MDRIHLRSDVVDFLPDSLNQIFREEVTTLFISVLMFIGWLPGASDIFRWPDSLPDCNCNHICSSQSYK